MTAEIAVMNKMAIALAADSAVTISERNQHKVYDTVNKLFALSKHHPVAAMVYGRADFMEVPWETVIKLYRSALGARCFATLEEHANDFLEFLTTNTAIADVEREKVLATRAIGAFLGMLRRDVDEAVKVELAKTGSLEEAALVAIATRKISATLDVLEGSTKLKHLPDDFEARALGLYQAEIEKAIAAAFGKLPLGSDLVARLKALTPGVLGRDYFPPAAGLVIAGYGQAEIFPHLFQYTVESRYAAGLKYRLDQEASIDHHTNATLVSFAQDEMVHTFMRGMEPNFQDFLNSYMRQLLHDYPAHIAQNLTDKSDAERAAFIDAWRGLGVKLSEEIDKKIDAYSRKFFIDPVVRVIASLPKDELAIMAETLVSLTSFKRKVTMDTESVGGPIDLAVLSKGDGLVWIKRKHYFSAELNPGFFANYYRREDAADDN